MRFDQRCYYIAAVHTTNQAAITAGFHYFVWSYMQQFNQ